MRIRWAKPLSSDRQRLQAFSQRFATPKVAESLGRGELHGLMGTNIRDSMPATARPRDDMARELAKSLLPQPTTAERQVEGSGMDTSDQAHWLSKQLASQGLHPRAANKQRLVKTGKDL